MKHEPFANDEGSDSAAAGNMVRGVQPPMVSLICDDDHDETEKTKNRSLVVGGGVKNKCLF